MFLWCTVYIFLSSLEKFQHSLCNGTCLCFPIEQNVPLHGSSPLALFSSIFLFGKVWFNHILNCNREIYFFLVFSGSDYSSMNFLSSYSWITCDRWNQSNVLQLWLHLLVLQVYYHLCYYGQLITWMFKNRVKNETMWYHCGYLLESIDLKQEQVRSIWTFPNLLHDQLQCSSL